MGNLFVVNWKGEVVKKCDLISGNHVDILPPLIGQPKYKLWFGPNCNGVDCPQSVEFEVQMGSAHVLHVHDGVSQADLYELVSRESSSAVSTMSPGPSKYRLYSLGHPSIHCHHSRRNPRLCHWSRVRLQSIGSEHEIGAPSPLVADSLYGESG